MQDSKKMDFRQLEDVIKQPEGFSLVDRKENLVSNFMTDHNHQQLDSGSALQMFLDHIPINSIPGIKKSPVVELKTGDSVKDAIHLLYEKNVSGAPIADVTDPDTFIGRFSDRFESEEHVDLAYGDQSSAEALHILWPSRIGVVAVVIHENKKVIGCVRNSDVFLLLENDELLSDRQKLTVEEFIHKETAKKKSNGTIERDLGALFAAVALPLRNSFLPKMDSPLTTKRSDALKQAMEKLAETKGCFCLLVNDSQQPTGLLTLRDVIIQFAPPCIDSNIHGGGFFESALEQTGCQVKNGTVICDH